MMLDLRPTAARWSACKLGTAPARDVCVKRSSWGAHRGTCLAFVALANQLVAQLPFLGQRFAPLLLCLTHHIGGGLHPSQLAAGTKRELSTRADSEWRSQQRGATYRSLGIRAVWYRHAKCSGRKNSTCT